MAEERPSTPEKQLLELIENPKAEGSPQRTFGQRLQALLSVTALRGRLSFIVERLRLRRLFQKPSLDIRIVNIVLVVGVAALAIYFVVNLIISVASLNDIPELKLDAEQRTYVVPPQATSLLKKLSHYLDRTHSRDIFRFEQILAPEEFDEVVAPEEKLISKLQEAMADLRLVGIAWSDEPDAMIEDTAAGKIHFVKRGDLINGKIKIEMIMQDRVVLSYEGEERELR